MENIHLPYSPPPSSSQLCLQKKQMALWIVLSSESHHKSRSSLFQYSEQLVKQNLISLALHWCHGGMNVKSSSEIPL